MKLGELATVIVGYSPKPEERKNRGKYLLIGGRNLQKGRLVKTDKDSYLDGSNRGSFQRAIARPGDIIISTLFDRRKLYIYQASDAPAVVNNSCAIIRSPENNDYILSYLKTLKGQQEFIEKATQATSGAFIPRLTLKNLADIDIPILPIHELALLGDAYIESATVDELETLKLSLQAKEAEIAKLQEQTKEIEFLRNRLAAIESQKVTNELKTRIEQGETVALEFKSTLRRNLKTGLNDKEIENAVLKTIAAMCNTAGGDLLIGVSDDKRILGLDDDGFDSPDKFLLHLRNLITTRFDASILQFVQYEIVTVDDKEICRVQCQRMLEGVWLRTEKAERFYVRTGPSSMELPASDAVRYIMNRIMR